MKHSLKETKLHSFFDYVYNTFFNLKRQCQKIFNTFLYIKNSTWAAYEQAKTVSQHVFLKIFAKNMYPCSR